MLLVLLALAACVGKGTVSSPVTPSVPVSAQSPSSCAGVQPQLLTLQPLTTVTLAPTPTFRSGQALPLGDLRMMTATTGWAIAGERLVRTVDGGAHWRDVTPSALHDVRSLLQSRFLSDSVGWVWTVQSGTTSLFRTTNGGQTWQQGAVFHSSGYVSLTFLNAQDGWALVDSPGSAGGTDVDLCRTSDGGVTWSMLATTGTAAQPGSIPAAGKKGGLSFLNPSTGWMGRLLDSETEVMVTHDGGSTWQTQPLPFQQDGSEHLFYIGPPFFFNEHEGVLWVSVLSQTQQALSQLLYLTHDGGASWQSIPPLAYDALTYFSDARHGWMLNRMWVNGGSSLQTTLSTTSDGGQHWNALPGSAAVDGISELDFLSSTLGWALSRAYNGAVTLLKTDDGGRTWAQVTPLLL
ncbi:MAG TPA: hypothetical protein VH540_15105 [Ktedonobacterales bacterium]|jgi:photosystem II stability/assembly factor-like uncharacterized protein